MPTLELGRARRHRRPSSRGSSPSIRCASDFARAADARATTAAGRQAEALEVYQDARTRVRRRARHRARAGACSELQARDPPPGRRICGDPPTRRGVGRGRRDRERASRGSRRAGDRPGRARRLSRRGSRRAFDVPARPADRPRARLAVRRDDEGSGPLYDELHEPFEAAVEPSPLHRFLATLRALLRERGAPHQLIVTTNYDLALERAFEEAEEELDIVAYVASGPNRGRFWHRPPGEPPRPIDVPNTYATELSLERRTILLKLHGAVDPLPSASGRASSITEDDYIELPRHARSWRCCAGRARGEAAAEPLPLPRLRDGRLEPAADPQPRSGASGRSPTARGPCSSSPSAARAGVLAPVRRRRRSMSTRTRYVELLERRLGDGMSVTAPSSPYKGLNAFEDSELDALLFFGRERETRDRRRQPHRVAADGALRAERRRQVVAAARRRRALAACAAGASRSSSSSRAGATTRRPRSPSRSRRRPALDDGSLADALEPRAGSSATSTSSSTRRRSTSSTTPTTAGRARSRRRCRRSSAAARASTSSSPCARTRSPSSTASRGGSRTSSRNYAPARPPRPRAPARRAIVGPSSASHELASEQRSTIEPGARRAVLDEVGAGRIEPGARRPRARSTAATTAARIEAPYLQLVMQRLWEDERAAGSRALRARDARAARRRAADRRGAPRAVRSPR